jgi:hypothetical protein
MPLGWAAAATAGSAVIGGATSLMAADKSASASKQASNFQMQAAAASRNSLAPYYSEGWAMLPSLEHLATSGPNGGGPDYLAQAAGMQPGQMTQAELEQTPGYQFNLAQGLKATQNAAAARGLGVSGAALKGAAKYATGLADSTYQNQFNNAQTRFQNVLNLNTGQQGNLTNQYNRLIGIATLGENAAAGAGAQGIQGANQAGNYLNQAGQAQAAGTLGVGSAVNQGVQNYLSYNALKDLTGQTSGYTPPAINSWNTKVAGPDWETAM